MILKRAFLLLVIAPLLSGCLTGLTIESAYDKKQKRFPDSLERIERATIIGNERLLVFVQARLTNSLISRPYTISIPLSDINTNGYKNPPSEKPFNYGYLYLRRNAIVDGWDESQRTEGKDLTIAPRINIPQGGPLFRHAEKFKTLENNDTIYQINYSGTNTSNLDRIELVYVSPTRIEAFNSIQVMNHSTRLPAKNAYLLLLPIAIPADIVTLPIQIPVFIAVAYSMGR